MRLVATRAKSHFYKGDAEVDARGDQGGGGEDAGGGGGG